MLRHYEHWIITCTKCGRKSQLTTKEKMSFEQADSVFRARGWLTDANKQNNATTDYCPKCVKKGI